MRNRDIRTNLQSMFETGHRYAAFGNVLTRINIQGIRCHESTMIDFESPITAICGLTGTGKSTILQVAAAAYRQEESADLRAYALDDFFPQSRLDPAPITQTARIEYYFATPLGADVGTARDEVEPEMGGDGGIAPLDPDRVVLRRSSRSRVWCESAPRPARGCWYVDVATYLPLSNQQALVGALRRRLSVGAGSPIQADEKRWTERILGMSYDDLAYRTARLGKRCLELGCAVRRGTEYSEFHMGLGEARTLHLVHKLETLPKRCLILIEEPESSLPILAQHHLGEYLIDVAIRRQHQIILTTRSQPLLEGLPSESWLYLERAEEGVRPIAGLKPAEVASLMSEGTTKALHVLVEDDSAQAILTEIVRSVDARFLRTVDIRGCGDKNALERTMDTLSWTDLRVAAVKDGDTREEDRRKREEEERSGRSSNVFYLPGSQAPEKEMVANRAVQGYLKATYDIDLSDVRTRLSPDHHLWFRELASWARKDQKALLDEVATVYARALPPHETYPLVDLLKEAAVPGRRTKKEAMA